MISVQNVFARIVAYLLTCTSHSITDNSTFSKSNSRSPPVWPWFLQLISYCIKLIFFQCSPKRLLEINGKPVITNIIFPIVLTACDEVKCLNGGTCKNIDEKRVECICQEDFFGQYCQTRKLFLLVMVKNADTQKI